MQTLFLNERKAHDPKRKGGEVSREHMSHIMQTQPRSQCLCSWYSSLCTMVGEANEASGKGELAKWNWEKYNCGPEWI